MVGYCSAGLCVRAVLDKRGVLDVLDSRIVHDVRGVHNVRGMRAYMTKKKDVLIDVGGCTST